VAHKRGAVLRNIRNSPGAQIFLYFCAFAMLVGFYTYMFHMVYPILEKKPLSWSASLLFVVDSMTTVGYGNLLPFENDLTNFLAIQIMISGVIMIFMVIPLLLAPFLTTLLAPAPPRRTTHVLKDHIVVIGYDELTRSLIDSLAISDHDIVIIEEDKETALEIAGQFRKRAYVIWGDYADPGTFVQAHIAHAGYIVINKDERLTADIVLGIRQMTRGRILAVVDKLSFERYLRYAGAEYVVSPKYATGRILARHAVINPGGDTDSDIPGLDRLSINLADHHGQELRLINIPVVAGCRAAGKTLRDLALFSRYGVLVPFLWRGGTFRAFPDESDVVDHTTSLFLFGRADAVSAAIREEFQADGSADTFAVIAGFGDVGAAAYQELQCTATRCIVVDAKQHHVTEVVGNVQDEEVLKGAGIADARFFIVAVNSDDVNIFATLIARNLNPGIRIMARANDPSSVEKLYRAGADYVALLPRIGGQIIGRILLAGTVSIWLDLPNDEKVIMKRVMTRSRPDVGRLRRKTGVRILGIESAERSLVAPDDRELLREGDAVIAMGETEQLKRLISRL
jgi:voltage-gated potassium channel